ncbi:MAG: UDP-N-acetylmuramoyl-tripeptide--D-alanyl-D-alanine ligase [Candidatus Saccharibacteria bacterium]
MKQLAKNVIVRQLNKKVRKLLALHNITLIEVTGTVGKTSTKVAIGKVLSSQRKVRYSEDSYNTDIGIPLSLFDSKAPAQLWNLNSWRKIFAQIDAQISNYPFDTVVLELAEDEPAMMARVQKILPPDITVITEVTPAHMERMHDIKTLLHNAWKIAARGKYIFYNADSEGLRKKAYKTGTTGYGLAYGQVTFTNIRRNSQGLLKAKLLLGKNSTEIQTKMCGQQNLHALLAAASVADHLGMSFTSIVNELQTIMPVRGRMNLLPAIEGARLIDDSYNSSPDAALAALQTLSEFKTRKIAVLGNMNELGQHSPTEHERVGKAASEVVDLLVVVGPHAEKYLAPAAEQAGLAAENIKRFRTPYEAGHYIKSILQKGDVVLVKGSQNGVYSEEVSRILLDPKLDPSENLVRQSKDWRRKKKKAFALH